MNNVRDLTIDELEYLIEQKILEVLGDPDSGLDLKEEFKQELKRRLENPLGRIPHNKVVSRIGQQPQS
jgi:RNase P/RNase MRP subunit POP5